MANAFTELLIEVDELNAQLNNTIVLDCRFSLADAGAGEQNYQVGHIPGAFYCHLDKHLSGEKGERGGRHPMPSAHDFQLQLMRWGIETDSAVVVYDDQRCGFAARAWWLLTLADVRNVRILNGGYQAWIDANRPQDRRRAIVNSATAVPSQPLQFNQQRLQHYADVIDNTDLLLIDSREATRYRGESEPIDPIAGHIPEAINMPWLEVTDDKGYLQPIEFHQRRWQFLQDTDKTPVVYCGSGVTACVNLFSAALAGYSPSIYPGSWSDWCNRENAPIATETAVPADQI